MTGGLENHVVPLPECSFSVEAFLSNVRPFSYSPPDNRKSHQKSNLKGNIVTYHLAGSDMILIIQTNISSY